MEAALSGQPVKVCVAGVVDAIAGENLIPGDRLSLGATAGRAYKLNSMGTGAGSAHTHAETLAMGVPSGTLANVPYNTGISFWYCAATSGGAVTQVFYALDAATLGSVADSTHNHTISGAITNESAHTHQYYLGRLLGKSLETFTTGNTGKILICLA